MAKTSGSIDLKSLKIAGEGASKYITEITSDGIFVSPSDQTPVESAEGNSVKINGDGMEIFKDGTSIAQYGSMARIGQDSASHIEVYGDSIVGVSSTGNNFFSVTESGGSTTTERRILISGRTRSEQVIDLTNVAAWRDISSGGSFSIQVSYYYRRYSGTSYTIIAYAHKTVNFTRGTPKTNSARATYDGVNTVTIDSTYPSMPSGVTAYEGHDAHFVYTVTTNGSLYRFGADVAESGGANGFMMGIGTTATMDNQLALGKYNASDNDAYLVIGCGTSDDNRLNAFKVDKYGGVYPYNQWMADFVLHQGTDGIWTWRKWWSGLAECWGRYSVTLTKYTTVGSFAGYYSTVSFPTDLFVSGSIPTHTYMATVGTGFAMPASGMNASNTSMYVYTLATASANNQSCVFDIVAKGRWK